MPSWPGGQREETPSTGDTGDALTGAMRTEAAMDEKRKRRVTESAEIVDFLMEIFVIIFDIRSNSPYLGLARSDLCFLSRRGWVGRETGDPGTFPERIDQK